MATLKIVPCATACSEDCYSVYDGDTCVYAHVSYDAAYRYVYGTWPVEE
jgi:hypothetical protein